MALLLERQGLTRVHPLEGGLAAWMELGFPVQSVQPPVVAVDERADRTPSRAALLGRTLGLVAVVTLAIYVMFKYARRRLFLRRLRIARISPASLKQRLDAGDDVAIIDLRTPLDVAATPYAIPGSRWLAVDAIDAGEAGRLRGRELVLYCA